MNDKKLLAHLAAKGAEGLILSVNRQKNFRNTV